MHACMHACMHAYTHIRYWYAVGFPSGIIGQNWNDTEHMSMAPAQGRRTNPEV